MTVLALLAATVLLLVGALHVVWMFSPWPLRTREEFARRVVDVPAVLALRGAGGLVMSIRRSTDFARLDRRYYSPLCLLLAVSCTAVAVLGQA